MRIAIVGTGPTGIYSFKHLIAGALPLHISLFEMGETLGIGMPYSPETASGHMLANIASIEIPPITRNYLDWMRAQDPAKLRRYGLDPDMVDERTFTPRLLLGEYFHDELAALIATARARGVTVDACPACRVIDVIRSGDGLLLSCDPAGPEGLFDKVILATGHVFEEDVDLTDHYFPNPWSGLLQVDVPAARVGILGTSLSAIDAAMAVATQHGHFARKGQELLFTPKPDSAGLYLTLMSWSGILPEADFYCPLPYTPLEVMTPEALSNALQDNEKFAAVYRLFQGEIAKADPAWAAANNLNALDPQGFHDAYFHDRETHDAFKWARANLDEVERNKAQKRTVAWRYAILRMHEQVETIVPALSEDELDLFNATLKKVFVDNYAAVPSESIRRLLALRDAGVLGILALGEDYEMVHEDDRTVITAQGKTHIFDIFIDARGQGAMTSHDLPFPSLRQALEEGGFETPDIGEDYGLMAVAGYAGRLYLAALPFLMQDQPFVQGITACADIGKTIAQAESAKRRRPKASGLGNRRI